MDMVATEVERLVAALETVGETDEGIRDLVGLTESDKAAIAETLKRLPDPSEAREGATVKAPSIFKMTFWR